MVAGDTWIKKQYRALCALFATPAFNWIFAIVLTVIAMGQADRLPVIVLLSIAWLLSMIGFIHQANTGKIKSVIGILLVGALLWGLGAYTLRRKDAPVVSPPPSTPPIAEISKPKITPMPEVINGGFESFFKRWDRFEKGQLITTTSFVSSDAAQYATAPTVGVSIPPLPGVFNIFQGVGNNRTNGLYIVCESKPEPEKYSRIQQEVEGLKPGALYKIRFWMERFENSTINPDSLYIALGGPWNNDNKVFYDKNVKSGWNEITIKNPSRETEIFYIVVNDVTNGLVLDDISIEEVNRKSSDESIPTI